MTKWKKRKIILTFSHLINWISLLCTFFDSTRWSVYAWLARVRFIKLHWFKKKKKRREEVHLAICQLDAKMTKCKVTVVLWNTRSTLTTLLNFIIRHCLTVCVFFFSSSLLIIFPRSFDHDLYFPNEISQRGERKNWWQNKDCRKLFGMHPNGRQEKVLDFQRFWSDIFSSFTLCSKVR